MHFQKSEHLLRSEVSLGNQKEPVLGVLIHTQIDDLHDVMDFDQKGTISRVRPHYIWPARMLTSRNLQFLRKDLEIV